MSFSDPICIFHDGCTDLIHAIAGGLLIVFGIAAVSALVFWIWCMIDTLYSLDRAVNYQREQILKLQASVDYLKKKVGKS